MKYVCLIVFAALAACSRPDFYVYAPEGNDLVATLENEGKKVEKYPTPQQAVGAAPEGASVLLLSQTYPHRVELLSRETVDKIAARKLKVYTEFFAFTDSAPEPRQLTLERVVVFDGGWSERLPAMKLLSINGSYVFDVEHAAPILVTAKVAGMDRAEYGLDSTFYAPLLYKHNDNITAATSALSNFATGRFLSEKDWKSVWDGILSSLSGEPFAFTGWLSYVGPAHGKTDKLGPAARKESIEKGIEWFYNGHFLVDESWKKDWLDKYEGDGSAPFGPELPSTAKDGDGTLGVLEGHCSFIYYNGTQQYRYWMRNDVQGESSMAFAMAGKYLDREDYTRVASNLTDHSLGEYRDGPRSDPESPSYGLLGWSLTHKGHYYQDDNARSVLGMLATASLTGSDKWDKKILENIVGNFRTTGKNGFRGSLLFEERLQKYGWEYYWNGDVVNPHPHLESWIWACYLYLYQKTGYEELLTRTKRGIRITMESYPDKWEWTNGIQQERARMILPLAWLARVEPTPQHLEWLDFMIGEVLKNQDACGAIREELGSGATGWYDKAKSNAEYGKYEAPLIHNNTDPVADMLYTSNFAFFALNEAAKVTQKPEHLDAVRRLSEFMTRIQVRSEKFKSLDGAWFRAFRYDDWDYWGSNADAGWGAWCTLTGWIQSWIVSTQVMLEMDTTLWDILQTHPIEKEWPAVKQEMLGSQASEEL